MSSILRYFISGSSADLLDLRTPGFDYSLADQQVVATGGSTVNHVRAALGVDLDARNLLGGEDVVVFSYRWDQYTKDTTSISGAIVFTYTDVATGLSEKVTVLNGSTSLGRDKLIFADGAVLTQNVRTAQATNLSAPLSAVPSVDMVTTTPTYILPTPAGNTLRSFASTTNTNGTGATFTMGEAGQTMVTTGTSQSDKVYVKAGAVVDARNLLGGEDQIYLTGNWADYSKSLTAVSGAIQFTRTVGGLTETVTVLNGSTALGRDKLIFGDGAVLTQNARAALTTDLNAAITAVAGYEAATATPFLKDIQGIGIINEVRASGYYKAGETITIAVDFKEAVTVEGTPRLRIVVGSTEKVIDFTGTANDGKRLMFQYLVQAGDADGDGIGVVDGSAAFVLGAGVSMRYSRNNIDVPLDHDLARALVRAKIDTTTTAPGAPVIGMVTDDVGATASIANGGASNDARPRVRVDLAGTNASLDHRVELLDYGSLLTTVTLSRRHLDDGYVDVIPSGLAEGAHSFTTRIVSATGLSGPDSMAWLFTLDATAPQVSVSAVMDDTDPQAGNVSSGGFSNDNVLTVRVNLSDDSVAVGDTLQLFNGGAAISAAVTVTAEQRENDGYVDIDTSVLIAGDTYVITVRTFDEVGNSSESAGHTVTIDTVAPDVAGILGLQEDSGSGASDYVSRNGTLLLDGLEVGAFVDVSIDGGNTWSRANGGAANTATTGSIALAAGEYQTGSIRIRQVDAAGNVGAVANMVNPLPAAARLSGMAGAPANTDAQTVAMTDGGYVVVWQGATLDGQGRDIFAQRYDAGNAAVGGMLRFKGVSGDHDDRLVQITALAGGGYALVWQGNTSSQGTDAYVQVVDSQNVAGDVHTLRGTTGSLADDQARITALAAGGFVVVWRSYNSTGTWDRDVLVQRFDGTGSPIGSTHRLGDTDPYLEDDAPQVCALSDGGYVVVWQGYTYVSGTIIYAQRFDAAGNAVGSQHAFKGSANINASFDAQVVVLAGGGYVVAWWDSTSSGQGSEVFVQRVDGNNRLLGSALALHGAAGHWKDEGPRLAALSGGGYVAVWLGEGGNGGGSQDLDIFIQQFNGDGGAVGSTRKLQGQSGLLADQKPQVAALIDGGFVVVWEGKTDSPQGTSIFLQQYNSAGGPVGGTQRLHAAGANHADASPSIAALDDGGYVVTWQGSTTDNRIDVFSQRFDAQGNQSRSLTIDAEALVFGGAEVNGFNMTLSYDGAIDSAALPDPGQFSVLVGGSPNAVSAVSASDGVLTLTLTSAVGFGQTVTLEYLDTTSGDDARAVQDLAGNDAASLAAITVINNTPLIAPTLKLQADTGSSASDGITSNGVVLVGGLGAGATWQYSVDGGSSWVAGTGNSFTLGANSAAHDVRVRQTVGTTTTSASGAWAVTVDQTSPTSTIAGFDKTGSTSGIVASTLTDVVGTGMTHTAGTDSALLEGTSEAYASVTFSIGGQSRTVTANGSGYWFYRLTDADFAQVDFGAETIAITQAIDRAGNVNDARIVRNVTFNAVADTTSHTEYGYGSDYVDALVYGGAGWKGTTITYSFEPGSGDAAWSAGEKSSFAAACQAYANVCNLRFVEGAYYADMDRATSIVVRKVSSYAFDNPNTLADFYLPVDGINNYAGYGPVTGRFGYQKPSWSNLAPGGLGFYVMIHELGHGLGLAHPFDSDPTFPGVDDTYDKGAHNLNQGIWTIMSYDFDWDGSPADSFDNWGMSKTPMSFDVAAMQALYGVNTNYRTGNDTYALPVIEANGTGWECIWDAGGLDTISNAGSSLACVINLNAYPKTGGVASEPFVSYVKGNSGFADSPLYFDLRIAGGFTIADGAIIENAIGGMGNDRLTGNGIANTLTGNGGADIFVFDAGLSASNIDTITDMVMGADKIGLSKTVFTAFAGASNVAADQIRSGAGVTTAADATDFLIYNTTTGGLYYDADGSGSAHAAAQFAWLQNKPITVDASAFLVL